MRREAHQSRSVNLPAITARADSADRTAKQASSSSKSGRRRQYRIDGYVNMLTKYGTQRDSSTAYEYNSDGYTPDITLTLQYETNGLFSKIIDAPAEEAVKHSFMLGLKSPDVETYIADMLDRLEWEEKASTAIKWARLYGGFALALRVTEVYCLFCVFWFVCFNWGYIFPRAFTRRRFNSILVYGSIRRIRRTILFHLPGCRHRTIILPGSHHVLLLLTMLNLVHASILQETNHFSFHTCTILHQDILQILLSH